MPKTNIFEHSVVLFPSYAHYKKDGNMLIKIRGWVYSNNDNKKQRFLKMFSSKSSLTTPTTKSTTLPSVLPLATTSTTTSTRTSTAGSSTSQFLNRLDKFLVNAGENIQVKAQIVSIVKVIDFNGHIGFQDLIPVDIPLNKHSTLITADVYGLISGEISFPVTEFNGLKNTILISGEEENELLCFQIRVWQIDKDGMIYV